MTTLDLDTLMRQAQQRKRTMEAQQQQQDIAREQAEQTEAIQTFRLLFDPEVAAPIQTALSITFTHETLYQCYPAYATFTDPTTGTWQIGRAKHNREYPWKIVHVDSRSNPMFVRDGVLCNWLLAELADVRDVLARAEAERQQRLEDDARRRVAWVADQTAQHQRAEAERVARQAEQQRVHTEIAALVERRIADATAALWRWPHGRAIVLYHWRWFLGADAEGATYFDEGWSRDEALDDTGYVTFHDTVVRTVRLLLDVHKPVVEQVILTDLDDVQRRGLTREKHLTLAGLACYDGIWRYVDDAYDSEEVPIGTAPVAWLAALIDA